jgi:hypothetical protein
MRRIKLLLLVLLSVAAIHVSAQEKKTGVIEIISTGGINEEEKIKDFFLTSDMVDLANVYHWKNHFVYYSESYDFWYNVIRTKFRHCTVKLYKNPFYDFERSRCDNKTVATEWDHIILTANLVKNPKLQQEYLN